MTPPSSIRRRFIVSAFFVVYALIGLRVVGDYPIPMDEPAQDLLGQETWKYIRGETDTWTSLHDIRYQSPLVETIIHVVTSSLIAPYPRIGPAYVMVRHLVIFLFFFAGVAVFYHLARKLTNDWRLALLGCGMLVLTPRFFAHSFFNSKDLPNVAVFTFAVWTLIRFLDRPTTRRSIIHGAMMGAAICTRPMGLFLYVLTIAGVGIDFFHASDPRLKKHLIYTSLLSVVISITATILFWPLLWISPLDHFLEILQWSQRSGGGFYFGKAIDNTPWHYLPVWIGITTPWWILMPFVIGIISTLYTMYYAAIKHLPVSRNSVIAVLWILLPWLAIVILDAGIFDEWRHVFFLYPGIVLCSLEGIRRLLLASQKLPPRIAILSQASVFCLLTLSMTSTTLWMMRNHPLQFAYFSVPSSWVKHSFDLDYWALSSRLALRAIIQQDDRPTIKIAATNTITAVNASVFFPSTKFLLVKPEEADYVIDNFRTSNYQHLLPRDHLLEMVSVDGIELMHVYRGPLSFTPQPDAADPAPLPTPVSTEVPPQ